MLRLAQPACAHWHASADEIIQKRSFAAMQESEIDAVDGSSTRHVSAMDVGAC